MVPINDKRLQEILNGGAGKRVLVLGDLMVDRYLWGNVSRISPEAPVPIINIEDDEIRLGGAANVANNLLGLGAEPVLVGVVGNDFWGTVFHNKLQEQGLSPDGLIQDASRPTTVKTRIIGNNQHIARVDREKAHPLDEQVQDRIFAYITGIIESVEGIILEDYNKGVLTPALCRRVIDLARQHHKIVTVDPKFDNFLEYRRVTLFKPNRKETEQALAMRLSSEEEIRRAGTQLLKQLDAQAVLITLGERGMALFERDGGAYFEGTRARKVADVSGAGDTVIATLTFGLTAGASMREAVTLSNIAAGIVCEEVGVAPITAERLQEQFENFPRPEASH